MSEERSLVQYQMPDVMTLGQTLAKSGYFQDAREASQAVVKILAGQELGLGAIAAMTGIYIVKGRVTLSANLIAAAIKRSGKYDYRIKRLEPIGCEIEFLERGKIVGTSTFTDEDAKTAGLSGDNWSKYRRNMHFARAMSNGAKWYCPDIFAGPIYTGDELGLTVDGETGEVIDAPMFTPAPTPVPAPKPAPAQPIAETKAAAARPATAENVRASIRKNGGWKRGPKADYSDATRITDGEPITEHQLGYLAGLIGQAVHLAGPPGAHAAVANDRHACLNYLCGVLSTKLLSKREATAMIDWLIGDDPTTINQWAAAEVAGVLKAAAIAAGQAELL